MKLNNKGQAFESFRLLIAFILALAMLTVIYSMIHKANAESVVISTQKFEEAIISANNSTGTSAKIPFVIEDLRLKGIISKKRISYITGLSESCIFLEPGPGFEAYNPNPNYLKIKKRYLKMNAYVYCNFTGLSPYTTEITGFATDAENGGCPRFCVIYLNKKPSSDIYS